MMEGQPHKHENYGKPHNQHIRDSYFDGISLLISSRACLLANARGFHLPGKSCLFASGDLGDLVSCKFSHPLILQIPHTDC